MSSQSFDAIVVGTGQSGPPLAVRMAKEGMSVAVVERARFGGTCVNYGCIPTKTLVASARSAHMVRRAADFGVQTGPVAVDMAKVHARMRGVAGDAEKNVEKYMRETKGIQVILGQARFAGPRKLTVAGSSGGGSGGAAETREIEAPKVFINVGARPSIPDLPGLGGTGQVPFLTNSGMLELSELPRHLVILGASYIGLEFGQMFRRFGSQVTVVERSSHFLPREDPDIAQEIRRILESEGIAFHVGDAPVRAEREGPGQETDVALVLASGTRLVGSHLLVATGRKPNTDDLGLTAAGVKTDARGFIEIDDQLRTSAEGVWALGDCNGKGAFTHTSYNDYEIAAANLFDTDRSFPGQSPGPRKVSDRIVTYALFIDPPLGRLGMNEAQVKARGKPALVGKMPVSRIGRARERSETDGLFKIHLDAETKQILGAAFLGIEGDEVVQMLAPPMMAKQPYTLVTHTVLIHPTVSELVPTLMEDFLKPLAVGPAQGPAPTSA